MFFHRLWASYESGFGDLDGNHWLGLTYLARLSNAAPIELIVEIQDLNNDKWYFARYATLNVSGSADGYRFNVSGFSGSTSDELGSGYGRITVNGMRFSTYDMDNDNKVGGNCAETSATGWWLNDCYRVNLNLPYGSILFKWPQHRGFPIKSTVMKIRQRA